MLEGRNVVGKQQAILFFFSSDLESPQAASISYLLLKLYNALLQVKVFELKPRPSVCPILHGDSFLRMWATH